MPLEKSYIARIFRIALPIWVALLIVAPQPASANQGDESGSEIAGSGDKAKAKKGKSAKKIKSSKSKIAKRAKKSGKKGDTPATTKKLSIDDVIRRDAKVAPKVKKEAGSEEDMIDIIDGVAGAEGGVPDVKSEPIPEKKVVDKYLPEKPSTAMVRRVVGGTMPKMRKCIGDSMVRGLAKIQVKNDGRVSAVEIIGGPAKGSKENKCVVGALLAARFPPFRKDKFGVSYPISVRPLK